MADKKFDQFVDGGEMKVGDNPVGLRPTSPSSNFLFDFPGTGIKDSNGNYLLRYDSGGASAINYPKITSSVIGQAVLYGAGGTDTDIDISIQPKGAGGLILDELNWPTADGVANSFMYTDGAGNLAFTVGSVTTAIIGTANQVLANGTTGVAQTGVITLTTPQSIGIASTPTFGGLTLSSPLVETSGGTGKSTYTLGDTLYSSASNTLSKLAGNITTAKQYLSQTGNGSASAAPIWTTITAADITGDALTKVDDTNVTLTLGGTPTTALLRAASITAGWTGLLNGTRGGTGVNNGSNTATYAGNLNFASSFTTSGAFAVTQTYTGSTNVTFPTSGTLATTSQIPSGAALTKVDDTNVTLTLGGSPTTALINASSITAGWTGQLGLTRGGTAASLTASNGGMVYSTASALAILAGTATARQMLQSAASGAPAWSTTTWPATTTVSRILYSSSANVIGEINTANSAMLFTNSTGVPAFSSSMTNGQIMIGSTGASPTPATLSAGAGISIANGAGTVTISGTGSGIGWTEVTGTSQTMTADTGWVTNNAGLVTLTLPTTAAFGTVISVIGKGAGGWKVAQNASQNIQVGSVSTTVGVGGSLASTNRFDSFDMICTTANTTWTLEGAPQSAGLTIV